MKKQEFIEYYKACAIPMVAMMRIAPKDKLDWKPKDKSWTLGQLLNHCSETPQLLEALALDKWPTPEELNQMMANSLKIPNKDGETAAKDFQALVDKIVKVISGVSDEDFLNKKTKSLFGGEEVLGKQFQFWTDHQNFHRVELFMYLKLIGLPVDTMTLYMGKVN